MYMEGTWGIRLDFNAELFQVRARARARASVCIRSCVRACVRACSRREGGGYVGMEGGRAGGRATTESGRGGETLVGSEGESESESEI